MVDSYMEHMVTFAGTFLLLIAVVAYFKKYWRDRRVEIDASNELLNEHAATLGRLIACEEASENLKRFLRDVTVLLASREVASKLVTDLFDGSASGRPVSEETRSLVDEISRLEEVHPGFSAEMKSFFDTGLYAMTLRWPETRGEYIRVTVNVEQKRPKALAQTVARNVEACKNWLAADIAMPRKFDGVADNLRATTNAVLSWLPSLQHWHRPS